MARHLGCVSLNATDMHNVHTVLGVLYFTAHTRGGGHYRKGYKMTLWIHNFSDIINKSIVKNKTQKNNFKNVEQVCGMFR